MVVNKHSGCQTLSLANLIDAQEKLSLQVHPPATVAEKLGSEGKNEFWYIVDAIPDTEIYVGLRRGVTRQQFEAAVESGDAAELVHRIPVKSRDAMLRSTSWSTTLQDVDIL